MLEELREKVLSANLDLVRTGLALYTFSNASGISRADGLVAIKPSGVPYENMKPEDLVVTDVDGHIVEGSLWPSSASVQKASRGIETAIRSDADRPRSAEQLTEAPVRLAELLRR
jgi:L-ribulose-5-phosphate 4-epimerase